jgi:hypothetical protein
LGSVFEEGDEVGVFLTEEVEEDQFVRKVARCHLGGIFAVR